MSVTTTPDYTLGNFTGTTSNHSILGTTTPDYTLTTTGDSSTLAVDSTGYTWITNTAIEDYKSILVNMTEVLINGDIKLEEFKEMDRMARSEDHEVRNLVAGMITEIQRNRAIKLKEKISLNATCENDGTE